jgi:hypothetical protein
MRKVCCQNILGEKKKDIKEIFYVSREKIKAKPFSLQEVMITHQTFVKMWVTQVRVLLKEWIQTRMMR